MMDDEANHLIAFGNFCNSVGITRDLITHDWTHFALRYNGPGNVQNYSRKLADAYRHRSAIIPTPSPLPQPETLKRGDKGIAVLQLQQQLIKLGYAIRPDGDFGIQTESAVKVFQQEVGLTVDGMVGRKTRVAIERAIG
jgi:murein L,D-transpeptidase YcbB/YkuD